jgi:hypothetical protein
VRALRSTAASRCPSVAWGPQTPTYGRGGQSKHDSPPQTTHDGGRGPKAPTAHPAAARRADRHSLAAEPRIQAADECFVGLCVISTSGSIGPIAPAT